LIDDEPPLDGAATGRGQKPMGQHSGQEFQGEEYGQEHSMQEQLMADDFAEHEEELEELGDVDEIRRIKPRKRSGNWENRAYDISTLVNMVEHMSSLGEVAAIIKGMKRIKGEEGKKIKEMINRCDKKVLAATAKFLSWNVGLVSLDYWTDTTASLVEVAGIIDFAGLTSIFIGVIKGALLPMLRALEAKMLQSYKKKKSEHDTRFVEAFKY